MQLLAQTSTSSSDAAAGLAALMGGSFLIFGLIFLVILVGIYYMILNRTGYNPWLSLLILIPGIGGLILIVILAFTEWPIQREVRALRAQGGGGTGYGTGAYGGTVAPGPGPAPGGPITPA